MKKICLVLLLAGTLCACSNEKKKEESTANSPSRQTAPDPDAMMKAWVDFATPGEEHSWLAKQNGTWVCDSVAQWMDPSQPPTYSKATDVLSSKMNGLYQVSEFSGDMGGQPMSGMGIMGFDKVRKKFVLSWIDNMGSGIVRMEGTYDETTKTLKMAGKQSDPGLQSESDIRQELSFPDEDTYTMTMYGTGHDGKEMKFMQGKFRRVKK